MNNNNNNGIPHPVLVVYTGQEITTIPRTVTHLVVASNVNTIEAFAFCQCHNLVSVEFYEGLEVISEFAFGYCTSLQKIKLPNSMRVVGRNVFTRCTQLQTVELNEGLLMLRDGVFSFCLGLKRLRIPSTVVEMERELLFSCSSLETLELPPKNTLRSIEAQALCGCTMLKSLALPSSSSSSSSSLSSDEQQVGNNTTGTALGDRIFVDCPELEELVLEALGGQENSAATADNNDGSSDMLVSAFQQRFHKLPIHELCYYQSYRPVFETIGRVQTHLLDTTSPPPDDGDNNRSFRSDDEELVCNQCPVDLFQMNPFHILALSTKPNYHLLNTLQRVYPLSAQFEKDVHGNTPIEYLVDNFISSNELSSSSSSGVVQSMMQSTMLDRLQHLPLFHRRHSHYQEMVEHIEILLYSRGHNTTQQLQQQRQSWRYIVRELYSKLSRMERHEALSLLELSVWTAKVKLVHQSFHLEQLALLRHTQAIHLNEGGGDGHAMLEDDDEEEGNRFKRARIGSIQDPILDRQACRVNCGADIILGNVISFLPPLFGE
ncbi:unnamed protein product [Cylindrotheca closterium]|uniref:Uncharacterized protein n=1 Tax=Cylindrotheca closterium TaxID=2856 RepID=A0AAD2GAI4_9STRA|nr:unnamed protein product [Cylindrotheca closterium]